MEDIGHKLREARERLGLTLNEVERITRIRVHYLEMLEKGDIEAMPSIVQARGFLNNYAEFLGLNATAVLDDFAAELQNNHRRSKAKPDSLSPPQPPTVQVHTSRPRWLSADLLVAGLGGLGVVAVLVWGGGRMMAGLRQGSEGGDQAAAPVAATTASVSNATLTPLPTAGEEGTFVFTPEPTSTAPNFIVGPANIVDLRIVGEMRAWLRVTVDGEEEYSGRISPGEMLEFQGRQVVEVTTGNGAGIRVYYNGQDQGRLGGFAEVVIRLWDLSGSMTPTPTLQLIPTETSTPTPTPTPTETGGN